MKCPNCGKETAEDSIFCEQCGTKLEKKKSHKTLWIIIAVVIAIAAGLIAFSLENKSASKTEDPEEEGYELVYDEEGGYYYYEYN